jgi:hypothetical protein
MKLTKQQFEGFMKLYKEAWDRYNSLCDENIFDDCFLSTLMFPAFDWIEKELGLINEYGDYWLINVISNGFTQEDIDKIYNTYIK